MEFYKGMTIILAFMIFLLISSILVSQLKQDDMYKSMNENIMLIYMAAGIASVASIFITVIAMVVMYTS